MLFYTHGYSLNDEKKERNYGIDLLKIFAIVLVFFNHTGRVGFSHFLDCRDSILYYIYMAISIFSKIAVPIFFMCSGSLLLGKEESLKKVITKRFLKYLFVILISSSILYIYLHFKENTTNFSVENFFKTIYAKQVVESYWYIYTYLGFILMLPFIRKLANKMESNDYLYMFILFSFMNIIPIFDFIIGKGNINHNGNFYFFITTSYIFYPIMGYFIDKELERKYFNKRYLIIMVILSIIAIAVSCLMTNYKCSLCNTWEEDTCQTFFNNLIFIPTISLFYTVKYIFLKNKIHSKIYKAIEIIGSATFGLYLFEKVFRQETTIVYLALWKHIHPIPASFIWVLVEFIGGCCIILILKKIPIIKRYI